MLDAECEIICRSHKLNDKSLDFLTHDDAHISIRLLDDRRFLLRTNIAHFNKTEVNDAVYTAHRFLLVWLVSLNVGGFAHFDLSRKDFGNNDFKVKGQNGARHNYIEFRKQIPWPYPEDYFDPTLARHIGRVFVALAQETDENIVNEYIKGLYHFNSHLYGIEFSKDSFSNFYRSFEHFVTRRILQTSKLKNEVKDICSALSKVGLPDKLQEMFRTDVYPIRSSQVMHAWQDQTAIDSETVGKIKLLCDAVMYKAYEPIWTDTIESE